MWFIISLVVIVILIAAWTLLRVASDADDGLDEYGATLKKLASNKHKLEEENLTRFNNETRDCS